ncbi:MAG: DUF4091 domain-containing protein [Armatimonadota bacterium]|nr:DUF4091 domain-containing protein [Armatimonadota bacterium]MDW8026511.1 DUF4091 domain-containing protein [Armatimonadota bacterium]
MWHWWCVTTLIMVVTKAMAWHHPLSYHGDGYWRTRAVVQVTNKSNQPQIGVPITLSIGSQSAANRAPITIPLIGKEVKAIRVCDEQGLELKYDLRTAQGAPKRNGVLQAGDQISFFVELAPNATRRYFIYADNPKAWFPPEFIRTGLANGSFEAGEGDPDDWERVEEDAQHRLSWATGVARTGKRSVQTVVAEGAPPTWVKFHQTHIPLFPNRQYRLNGWVRAERTKGTVGFFIHVFGEKGEWLINRVLNAGDGTYDWRQIEFTFTVPENGRYATVGTVLYGTGTAWFDDISLELVEIGELPVQAEFVGVETMELVARTKASSWIDTKVWRDRVPMVVYHFGDKVTTALIYADLRKVIWRFSSLKRPVGLCIVDPEAPKSRSICSHWRLGNGVLFLATLPPRSAKRFDLYLSPIAESEGEQGYEALLSSPANLVPNSSFEEWDSGQVLREVMLPKLWRINQVEGIRAQLVKEGRFGELAAKLEIAPKLEGQWIGWRLSIPVKPNKAYFYCGFIKAEHNPSPVRLHGHWHNAKHQLAAQSPFFSTSPVVAAGQGWMQTFTFVESPSDAAFAELHLTTNTSGTFWHDGIFFSEVHRAVIGNWERSNAIRRKGIHVWTINSLVKVFPDTPPEPMPKVVSVLMARNEYEPVQIALRSDQAIRGVRVEVTPLKNAQGKVLPPPELWRIGYVLVDHPSAYYSSQLPVWYRLVPKGQGSSDGWAGEWADPLMPLQPFDLQPNRTEAILLVLYTPPDTPSGRYEGQIRVVANGKGIILPLQVEVVPLTLPQETELVAIFDLRGRIVNQLRSDINQLRAWYRFLSRFRISPGFVFPEPTFQYEGGKIVMDTKGFDEVAQFLLDELKVSALYSPGFLYAFGWAYPPKRFFNLEPFTPEYNQAYQALLKTFFEHVRKFGWGDKFVYYISDEPHYWHERIRKQMKQICKLAHEAVAGIRIYSSTWGFVSDWVGDLDIWGIGPHGSCSVDDMERLRKAGAKLWFTTDGHMCIDTPYLAIERLLPYLCFSYGVSGYEFWGVSWWTYNPWERGWHTFIRQSDEGERFYWVRYPNGDGYLVYPGDRFRQIEPLPSIRLMQVREGIEDYLIMRAIERNLHAGTWQDEKAQLAQQILGRIRKLATIPNQGGLRSTELLPDPDEVINWRNEALRLWQK